jgi:hypothetical protein
VWELAIEIAHLSERHGKPENHKCLYDHGKFAFSLREIGIAAVYRKIGKD